jgi:hypothetical protein
MNSRCISGKRQFSSEQLAEDVLVELWSKNDYVQNHAPIAVYKCDDCGLYHLTSRGPMSQKLSDYLKSSKINLDKEANKWLDKLKRR